MTIVTQSPDSGYDRSASALLDYGTQLEQPPPDGFALTVYPDCGEATAAFVACAERPDPQNAPDRATCNCCDVCDPCDCCDQLSCPVCIENYDTVTSAEASYWSMLDAETRRKLNVVKATKRAKGKLRRYAVQNKLTFLHTLTYRCLACNGDPRCVCGEKLGPESAKEVKRHVAAFMRSLRDHRGGQPIPYAYVIERGKKGTQRLHVHVLLPFHLELSGKLGDAPIMASIWGWGTVDLQFRGGSETAVRAKAKACARYLTKYLAKSLADEDDAWSHSYERSQGFNVRMIKRARLTYSDALTVAAWLLEGQGEIYLSDSDDWVDYEGPPAFFMSAG